MVNTHNSFIQVKQMMKYFTSSITHILGNLTILVTLGYAIFILVLLLIHDVTMH